MNPILYLYVIAKRNRWLEKRVIWRAHYFVKKLVRDRFFKVRYLDKSFAYVCPTHSSGLTVLLEGVHEPEIVQIIQHFVRQGYAFIDVGANIGLHTIAASSVCLDSEQFVYAFEPEDSNFKVLEKNCKVNRFETTMCIKAALGDEVGVKKFYLSSTKNKGKHSLIEREETLDLEYQVDVLTLDEFFAGNQLEVPKAALVKIDVEGFEYFTILGAQKTLTEINEGAVVVEMTPGDYGKFNHVSIRKVFELLVDSGFSSIKVVNEMRSLSAGNKLAGATIDLVFLKGQAQEIFSKLDADLTVDLEVVGGLSALEDFYRQQ